MSNILTISRLRSRQTCARKHHYEYVEGWRPVQEPEYFAVGRSVHAGLEAWWDIVTRGERDPLEAAIAQVHGLSLNPDPFQLVVVEEILRAYDARWRADATRYELVANESTFTAPLINPETGAASRTWILGGVVDKIVRDRQTGRTLLIEHKTTGEAIEKAEDPYWAKLAIDAQVSQYFIGAEVLGHPVDACLYDVVKKPGQKPLKATPPEARKYTKDGRLYAQQREQDETPDEYRERVRAAMTENLERYLQRKEVARLETQLQDHYYDVWSMGKQMAEDERLRRAPRNPQACHAYGICPFWLVCSTSSQPSDHAGSYVQVADVHPELSLVQR